MHYARTALLLAVMTALFMAAGMLLGGVTGMVMALLAALVMNTVAWWRSGDMVLSMYGAREVDAHSEPGLYAMTQTLVRNAGMPMPRLYIIDSPQPNAFATGRNPDNAAVAVNTGLLDMLTRDEVAGVIAHELAHIRHRDTLLMTITATFAGAISMLANFGLYFSAGQRDSNSPGPIASILLAVLTPVAAMIVQMAISRSREYEADRLGAEICGSPMALASALAKIHNAAHQIPNPEAEHHPATAHMFIINPLAGGRMDSLFATHPDTGNRIAALERIAAGMSRGIGRDMDRLARGDGQARRSGLAGFSRRDDADSRQRGPWG